MGDTEKNKKVECFKAECQLFQLPFQKVRRIYPNFWDYLYDIVSQKPHEQHPVQTGVVFTKNRIEKDDNLKEIGFEIKDYYLDDSADGKKVFWIPSMDNNPDRTIIFNSEVNQIDLLSFVDGEKNNNIIVTRSRMEIRVFYQGSISVYENRDWMIYRNKESILTSLAKYSIMNSQLFHIIEFAYYDLAINKVGATLVFFTNELLDWSGMEAKKVKDGINLNTDLELALLKKYARTHDGAIIIDPNNALVGRNAKLTPTEQSIETVSKKYKFEGMRHTSSCAYTYEHHNSIVITTSDDGGATIFINGDIVLSNRYSSSEAQKEESATTQQELNKKDHKNNDTKQTGLTWKHNPMVSYAYDKKTRIMANPSLIAKKTSKTYYPPKTTKNHLSSRLESFRQIANEYGEYSEIEYSSTKCPSCNRQYRIGYIRVSGWNDHEELRCSDCGTVYYSKSCFELIGEPISGSIHPLNKNKIKENQ